MIQVGKKKLWISVLLVLLVAALTAGLALMFTRGRMASADESHPAADETPADETPLDELLTYEKLKTDYEKSSAAPTAHDDGSWAEFQKTGNEATVYKATFREKAKTAWIGLAMVNNQDNAKVEVSNDGTKWVEKLVATKEGSVYSLPEDLLIIQSNSANDKHCYLDVTDLLKAEGPTDIYIRLGAVEGNANCLGLFELKFFEGFVITEPNKVLGAKELANTTEGSFALKQETWFAHSTTLKQGVAIGVNGNGAFLDTYGYGLWTVAVPATAKEVSFGINDQSMNENSNALITAYANGKKVSSTNSDAQHLAAHGGQGTDFNLTEELEAYIGTDFRLTIEVSDSTTTNGWGPQPKFIEFNYSIPGAETAEATLPADETALITNVKAEDEYKAANISDKTDSLTKKDKVKIFEAKKNTQRLEIFYGYKSGETEETETAAGNNFMPYFDAGLISTSCPTYVRAFGIYKFRYGANSGLGYLKVPIAGSYLLKVFNGRLDQSLDEDGQPKFDADGNPELEENVEDDALAKEVRFVEHSDIKFAEFDAYTTVASQITPIVGGKTIYVDVSEYLSEEGGVLYMLVTDPTVSDRNGPQLITADKMGLYTYSLDDTPFTAKEATGDTYIGGPDKTLVNVALETMAEGEGIGTVKLGEEELKVEENDFAWIKEFTELGIKRSLFEEAGTYTVTLISDKNAARTATVTIEVKQDSVTGISVKTQPTKTTFQAGDALDFAGGKLELTWESGGTSEINLTANGVTASATTAQATAGKQTVTFTYAEKTATVELTITAAAAPGDTGSGETTPGETTPGTTTPGETTAGGDDAETPSDSETSEGDKTDKKFGCRSSLLGSSTVAVLLMASIILIGATLCVVRKKQ